MPAISKHVPWMLFLILLAACGTIVPSAAPIPTSAPTFTTVSLTTAAVPTETSLPTEIPIPTEMLPNTPMPTQTPPPLVTVAGLRVAYIIDGNLYVQDSGAQPIRLTNSGKDSQPVFSDDGQKLIFRRKEELNDPTKGWSFNTYSINADSTHEQLLVNASKLKAFGAYYDDFSEAAYLEFAPGTHHLLFNTRQTTGYHQIAPWENLHLNQDLFSLDADSGEMKQLLSKGFGGHFDIAPNGKVAWLLTLTGPIHIIDLSGKVVQGNIAEYPVGWMEWSRPPIQWSDDSNKLIVIPIAEPLDDSMRGFTIWRYILDNTQNKTSFDLPGPSASASYKISPDGNWVLYSYINREGGDTSQDGVYLGDLRTGTTSLIGKAQLYGLPASYFWSPDSTHFISSDPQKGLYSADINGKYALLQSEVFDGWLDANHYLYRLHGNEVMGEVGADDKKFNFIQFPGKKTVGWDTFVFLRPGE
jgi:hypothetical protein